MSTMRDIRVCMFTAMGLQKASTLVFTLDLSRQTIYTYAYTLHINTNFPESNLTTSWFKLLGKYVVFLQEEEDWNGVVGF